MAEVLKALKVKTASLKRVQKELAMYEKERDKEQGKVDKMKAEGADPHDLKQAVSAQRASSAAYVVRASRVLGEPTRC